ncbi:helix-turn-helix transcriptional regulator [Leifsonia sp. F6_8S_P_1B]|uniref:Helix-turn-helix transcriptional regulator n=1 Tax=Leifsonia williamsii TaxID=3035919 RepID=A0ABT8KES2_9MICO|nr:helix-turn-helix transcriptional regulator [Leifsonia williamsii]MDN4615964.1 helix-turn-helix transcriptional regulator [Leifsonia williamsii]
MARHKQDPPSHFGDLVAEAIRRGMRQLRLSGRGLAHELGRSETYVRDRISGKYEFSLADVEAFARFLGTQPEDFIARIDREVLEASLRSRGTPPPRVVPLVDAATGGRVRPRGGSVGAAGHTLPDADDFDYADGGVSTGDVGLAAKPEGRTTERDARG